MARSGLKRSLQLPGGQWAVEDTWRQGDCRGCCKWAGRTRWWSDYSGNDGDGKNWVDLGRVLELLSTESVGIKYEGDPHTLSLSSGVEDDSVIS